LFFDYSGIWCLVAFVERRAFVVTLVVGGGIYYLMQLLFDAIVLLFSAMMPHAFLPSMLPAVMFTGVVTDADA